jgi:hypothetical protein
MTEKQTKEFSLVEAEDDFMTTSKGLHRRRPGLHPTEASVEFLEDGKKLVIGKCMRALWYRSMEVSIPDSASAGLMQKAALGKWDEGGVVDRWKKMGVWHDNNIKFYQRKYYLSGELDAVLKNPITNGLFGIEVKSFYGYYANKIVTGAKREKIPGVPKDNQFLQAILYAWEYRDVLEEFRMYYIDRGDGHRVEFRIGFDETPNGKHQVWWQQIDGKYWNYFVPEKVYQPYTIEDIYTRYDIALKALKEKKLPAKDYSNKWDEKTVEWMWEHGKLGKTKYTAWQKSPLKNPVGDWQCSYCEWKAQCVQDDLTTDQEKRCESE